VSQVRRPIYAESAVVVPFEPERLWPYVADTNRMDRAVGLPRVHYTQTPRPEGGEAVSGEYRLLGRGVSRWIEYPFEWEWPARFSVVREYASGPLVRFEGGTILERTPGGTRLRSFVAITPRHRWLGPLVRFGLAPIGLRRAARQHRAIAAFLAARAPTPFPALERLRTPADRERLAGLLDRLRAEGAPAEPARCLGRLLADGADEDVSGMRPIELARGWRVDARETLETFIRATVAGLLVLRWELLCPRCRGVKASAERLRELAGGGFCPTCNEHFVADRDEAIEARFYPHPALRPVEVGTYCLGSPAETPHRLAQATLPPGATRAWRLDLPEGSYHVSSPQSRRPARLDVGPGADGWCVALVAEPDGVAPATSSVGVGGVTLMLRNACATPVTLALDDARWSDVGATPGRLMALPAFHALLSDEALAPGFELAVGRVGLLFSDLAGSTGLYERSGDARAFRLVGEHFTLLQGAIERAGGAVVKTIGDAVMAAFPDGRAAVAAALAMQRAIRDLDTGGLVDPTRLVKVGVHVGACYAVTLNDRLDYFGTAVNLAARAQHEALGGEVVATAAAYAEAGAELALAGVRGEPFDVRLRGFSAPIRLYRIDCSTGEPR
jgi:class 3 adenylate cyclase